jgi:hypothetical protein
MDFGSTTDGIVLNSGTQNPATIVSGTYVTNTTTAHSGTAVYGASGYIWTVSNYGTVLGTDAAGVVLHTGGSVTNGFGGLIDGREGIQLENVGIVVNAGTIMAADGGVYLKNGGSISNLSGGLINSAQYGVGVSSVQGVVTNAGTIEGFAEGVFLAAGSVYNVSGQLIASDYTGIGMNAGTVTNAGTIDGDFHDGIFFRDSGSVNNLSKGLIEGGRFGVELNAGGALYNAGTIEGNVPRYVIANTYAKGVVLSLGGSVKNTSDGLIWGYDYGIFATSPVDATIFNSGRIGGAGGMPASG